MLKIFSALFFYLVAANTLLAQTIDTLSNLAEGTALYAPVYSGTGQWGFLLGQNSSYRQQFAEKYEIEGTAHVTGLIAHLAGEFRNPNNFVEFNVYRVASNGLPGARIGGKQVLYQDLDLSGQPMAVHFTQPLPVAESFFVTFNVMDYLHGGYNGDTLGLMAGEPGSRLESDLENFGRNAVQAHNHSKEDWKDFYSQNFTPIATHFALFPIVESNSVPITGILDQNKNDKKLFFSPPSPNPARQSFMVRYSIENATDVVLGLYTIDGKWIEGKTWKSKGPGEHAEEVEVRGLAGGIYVVTLQTREGKATAKVIVE